MNSVSLPTSFYSLFYGLFVCLFTLCPKFCQAASAPPQFLYTNQSNAYIENKTPFKIIFDETIVPPNQVGKPVSHLSVTPQLSFTATWTSRNEITVIPQESPAFRTLYTWKLPEGTKTVQGTSIVRTLGTTTSGNQDLNKIISEGINDIEKGVLLITEEKDFLQENPPTAITFVDKITKKRYPAKELVSLPSSISKRLPLFYSQYQRNNKAQKKLFPHYYVLEAPLPPQQKYNLCLTLHYSEKKTPEGTLKAEDFSFPYDALDLNPFKLLSFTDNQLRLETSKDQVLKEKSSQTIQHKLLSFSDFLQQTPEDFFDNSLTIICDGVEAQFSGEHEKTVKIGNKTYIFSLDKDFLAQQKKESELEGKSSDIGLTIQADYGAVIDIIVDKKTTSIRGEELPSKPDSNILKQLIIKPLPPTLYLDFDSNGIIYSGSKTITLKQRNLADITLKIKRIASNYRTKTLDSYKRFYLNSERAGNIGETHFLPFDMLATTEEVGQYSLTPEELQSSLCSLPLEKIMGRPVPSGMYFIEVLGKVNEATLDSLKRFGYEKYVKGSDNPVHFSFDSYSDKEPEALCAVQGVIQITDLGVLWKRNDDHFFGYVYSLTTGQALEQAEIEFLRKDGKVLGSAHHNRNKFTYSGIIPKGTAFLRIGSTGDSYLTPINSGELYLYKNNYRPSYYIDILRKTFKNISQRRGYLFTDRHLYNPGDTLHIKGFFRQASQDQLTCKEGDKATLTLELKGSTSLEILKKEITLDEFGSFAEDVILPRDLTGSLYCQVQFPNALPSPASSTPSQKYALEEWDRANNHFSKSVKVEYFKRQSFSISLPAPNLMPGQQDVSAQATATDYTKTPIIQAQVKWILTSAMSNFYPSKYQDYLFGDYTKEDPLYWARYYGFNESSEKDLFQYETKDQISDNQGKSNVSFHLKEPSIPTTLQVKLQTIYTTKATQERTGIETEVTQHPASLYVGIKKISALQNSGDPLRLDFLTVDTNGEKTTSSTPIHIKVLRKEFSPTRLVSSEGTTVSNTPDEETVYESDFILNEKQDGNYTEVPKEKPGIYTIIASGKDPEGHDFQTSVLAYIYGGDFSPWEYNEGLELNLIPDKKEYKPGETARLLLQTPFEGDVMVTLERNAVSTCFTRHITLQNPVIEIPLTEKDAPIMYASVFLVKGAQDSLRQAKNPQIRLGYSPLYVTPQSAHLSITLTPEKEQLRPQQSQTLTGVVTTSEGKPSQKTNVTLYAVDQGIVDYSQYSIPQPLKYFYSATHYPLMISTYSMLYDIISENIKDRSFDNKGEFIGGGGVSNEMIDGAVFMAKSTSSLASIDQQNIKNFSLRKDFTPTPLWKAHIITDEQGKFTCTFTNPDTLTQYKVYAIAADKENAFGSGETSYLVDKPVILTPTSVDLAYTGDKIDFPFTVTCPKKEFTSFLVSLTTESPSGRSSTNSITHTYTQTVSLNDFGQADGNFTLTFPTDGITKLTWKATPIQVQSKTMDLANSMTDFCDAVEGQINVGTAPTTYRYEQGLILTPSSTPDFKSLIPTGYAEKLTDKAWGLSLGTSCLQSMVGDVTFLKDYPYGCTEQLCSKLIPWIEEAKKGDLNAKKIVQTTLHTILERQNIYQGGFSYWGCSQRSNPTWLTPYVGLILYHCTQIPEITLPETAQKELIKNLLSIVGKGIKQPQDTEKLTPFSNLSSLQTQATYASWVLALWGEKDTAALHKILEKEQTLSDDAKLYLALALSTGKTTEEDHQKALQLLKSAQSDTITPLNLIAQAQLLPTDEKTAENLYIFLNEKYNKNAHSLYERTSWSSAWDLLAAYAFENLNQNQPLLRVLTSGSNQLSTVDKEIPNINKGAQQLIKKLSESLKDKVKAYYFGSIKIPAQDTETHYSQADDQGFLLSRTYEKQTSDGAWQASHNFNVGDLVRVTLQANLHTPDAHYAVIEDRLPAGFTPLNPHLDQKSIPTQRADHSCNLDSRTSYTESIPGKIRFYVDSWGNPHKTFTVSYLTRVTKSGVMTAPSAKAELMYKPQVYGLSPAEQFTILPQ